MNSTNHIEKNTMNLTDELVKATKKMNEELDSLSNEIAYLEKSLQEAGLRMSFEMKIDAITSFRWCADPESKKGKKWRLFLFDTESETSIPLRQTKSEVRLKYCQFLNDFVTAFIKEVNATQKRYSKSNIDRQPMGTGAIEKIKNEALEKKVLFSPDLSDEHPEYKDDLPY